MKFLGITFLGIIIYLALGLEAQTTDNATKANKTDKCLYEQWSEWSNCWATCGIDAGRSRYRAISMIKANDTVVDFKCDDVMEQQNCRLSPCPNDCLVSAWSDWGQCNCQINQTQRTRSITRLPKKGGRRCQLNLREVKACSENDTCIEDCQLGEWLGWSECSATCGPGISVRQRPGLTLAINGGLPCPIRGEIVDCNLTACPFEPNDNLCQNGTTGNFPDPRNPCSRFYVSCASGVTKWQLCPDRLRYRSQNNTCDYPENLPECQLQKLNGSASIYGSQLFKSLSLIFAIFLFQ